MRMQKLYKLGDDLNAITELQDYLIEKYKVYYQIFGQGYNWPEDKQFELYIAMGDDCATHLEVFDREALQADEELQELLQAAR